MDEVEEFKKRVAPLLEIKDINKLSEIAEDLNEYVSVRNVAHSLIVDLKKGTIKNTLAVVEFLK